MKVLHVINSLGTGGAEKLILDTLPLLSQKKGVEIHLALLDAKAYPFYEQMKKNTNIKIIELSKGTPYNPLLIFKMIPLLREYDLVHVHLFPAMYFVAFAKLLSLSKVKLVFSEHCTFNTRTNNMLLSILDKKVYKLYDHLIAVSHDVKSAFDRYLNKFPITLIDNGVDLSRIFTARGYEKEKLEIKQIDKNDFLIAQISSFRGVKRQDVLVKAMSLLPESAKLLLIGDGPDERKKQIKTLVKELDLEHRVFFLGLRMDIPELLKTVHVNVLSSDFEGLSLSSIEGMASEKPFVASDVEGLRDIVNGSGILFENENYKELSSILLKLMTDKQLAIEVGKKCKEKAKQYDIQKTVDQTFQLYRRLLK